MSKIEYELEAEEPTTQAEVVARIYCLGASILMGKATEEEIQRVNRLAIKHNCFDVFKNEIEDCDRIINEGPLAPAIPSLHL